MPKNYAMGGRGFAASPGDRPQSPQRPPLRKRLAPAILGVVLGGMLEENFITSVIKAEGNLLEFVARPIAASLAAVTVLVWFTPIVMRRLRTHSRPSTPR